MIESVGITGTGAYLPERAVTNAEVAARTGLPAEEIHRRTGIERRHFGAEHQATSDLAAEAARRACAQAKLDPAAVELIIVATCTPDHIMPATACLVQAAIGAEQAAAMDLCGSESGFLAALATAQRFVQDGTYANALVIGAEAVSKHLNWNVGDGCYLMGDGAGAVVLQPVPDGYGILGSWQRTDGAGSSDLHMPAGGSALPSTLATIEAGQHTVRFDVERTAAFAARAFPESVLAVLRRCDLRPDEVAFVVPHQWSAPVLRAGAAELAVPGDRIVTTIADHGNTLNASLPLALDMLLRQGRVGRDDLLILSDFGAGYAWGAMAIRCQ